MQATETERGRIQLKHLKRKVKSIASIGTAKKKNSSFERSHCEFNSFQAFEAFELRTFITLGTVHYYCSESTSLPLVSLLGTQSSRI